MSYLQLVLITIAGWGVGTFFYKLAADRIDAILLGCIATMIFIVSDLCYLKIFKVDYNWNYPGVTYTVLGALAMAFGSLAYTFALQRAPAGEVNALTGLYPALTFILSFLFLGEEISIRKITGIAFALVGIYCLSGK